LTTIAARLAGVWIIVIFAEVMRLCLYLCLFVCLSVCLSARLLKKLRTDFSENFWRSGAWWPREQSIRRWWRSSLRFWSDV